MVEKNSKIQRDNVKKNEKKFMLTIRTTKSREIKEENCGDCQTRIIHRIRGKIDYTIILTVCKWSQRWLFVERLEKKKKERKVSIFCSMGGRVYGSRSNRDIRSLWNFMLTYGTCIFHDFIIISHLGLRNAKFLEWAFYRFCRSEIRAGVPTIKVIFVWLGHISSHDTRVHGVFVYFQEGS